MSTLDCYILVSNPFYGYGKLYKIVEVEQKWKIMLANRNRKEIGILLDKNWKKNWNKNERSL